MISPIILWRLQKQNKTLLSLKGKILTYTTIYTPPQGFENQAPYTVAVAKLENGQKLTTQVVNPQKIKIGSSCQVVIRRLKTPNQSEVIDYGPKLEIINP